MPPPDVFKEDERVVRSIKKGWLNKKGEVQYSAFRPRTGSSLVSLITASTGADYCKNKSVGIHGADYRGLAVLQVVEIRRVGAEIVDASDPAQYHDAFPGHVHLDHVEPAAPASSDPLEPGSNKILNERCKKLARDARFHLDPTPEIPGWSGAALE